MIWKGPTALSWHDMSKGRQLALSDPPRGQPLHLPLRETHRQSQWLLNLTLVASFHFPYTPPHPRGYKKSRMWMRRTRKCTCPILSSVGIGGIHRFLLALLLCGSGIKKEGMKAVFHGSTSRRFPSPLPPNAATSFYSPIQMFWNGLHFIFQQSHSSVIVLLFFSTSGVHGAVVLFLIITAYLTRPVLGGGVTWREFFVLASFYGRAWVVWAFS